MIRVLHLASFNGNIGDIANHIGFWNLFKKYVSSDVDVTFLEIREFYQSWNLRKFDDDFIKVVNGYDLLVIGGGNFFDIKWEYSRTGITLDIPPNILARIKIPVVFNGIGIDYNPETCSTDIKERFETFISYINSHQEKFILSFRNDDSRILLQQYFDESDYSNCIFIPDGGFFTTANSYHHPEIPQGKTVVSINVAKDRIEDRWGDETRYKLYCQEFSSFLNKAIKYNDEYHFVFIPHIPSDLQSTIDVLKDVKDYYMRRNISIAPYLNGFTTPGDYQVDLYRKSNVAIGMRYHSNICSIAMRTPTIGIVTLNKHIELYRNIGMGDRLFNVTEIPFADNLNDRLASTIQNRELLIKQNDILIKQFEKEIVTYYEKIAELLN